MTVAEAARVIAEEEAKKLVKNTENLAKNTEALEALTSAFDSDIEKDDKEAIKNAV
jgi:hypothetical protein